MGDRSPVTVFEEAVIWGGWNWINDAAPPPRVKVLGWDVCYGAYHVCSWDGFRKDDHGVPRLLPEHGDDLFIEWWTRLPPQPTA